jgi:uncharacterized membrane protein YqjE
MALLESAGRIGATLVAMLQTRLELAVVEVEEESQRFLRYLILSLLALFLFGIASVLVALFVVVLFWDSYRLAAVAGMTLLFIAAGAFFALKVRAEMRTKPALLADTINELRQDIACIRGLGSSDTPGSPT